MNQQPMKRLVTKHLQHKEKDTKWGLFSGGSLHIKRTTYFLMIIHKMPQIGSIKQEKKFENKGVSDDLKENQR